MAGEIQRGFYRVHDVQKLLGYENEYAARRLLERLDKCGTLKFHRLGRALFVSINELNDLLGLSIQHDKTQHTAPDRAVG